MADEKPTAETTKPKNKAPGSAKAWPGGMGTPGNGLNASSRPNGSPTTAWTSWQTLSTGTGPGTKYQLIADAMVRNNEVPTIEKVAARYESRKTRGCAATQRPHSWTFPLPPLTSSPG